MNQLLSITLLSKKEKEKLKNFKALIVMYLVNNDTSLTEKIIQNNIQFSNLKYKITITQMTEVSNAVRLNYLQEYNMNPQEKITLIDFVPGDISIELNDLNPSYIYKVRAEFIEKIVTIENQLSTSNTMTITPRYGLVTKELINKLHNERYKTRKDLCKSEKDSYKHVNNEIHYQELESVLPQKDIKSLTYEGRLFDDMNQFVNSNLKSSKLMTDTRKKKILYSTQSILYFDRKMDINLICPTKNPFMKNEWFMGPVYSYDYNYEKYS